MLRQHTKCLLAAFVLLLFLCAPAVCQDWEQALEQAVTSGGVFPEGTCINCIDYGEASITVDLGLEAITNNFNDTMSDDFVEAITDALTPWPEFKNIEVTVGGLPLWQYLPPQSEQVYPAASQNPQQWPSVTPVSTELAGKLVVLHPSHGSYVYGTPPTTWYRAMRTYCGPNPVTSPPPQCVPGYQASDYYYYTRGFQWPMYYEDDYSPETIRFLYAYCQASSAATYCSRNLDKTAGNYDAVGQGWPAPSFTLPKWMTATKYALQDRGGIPSTVWETTDVTTQSDRDIRARPYYVNWLMQTLNYNSDNSVSFSLHSNAATTGTPVQSQARGTETYWYTSTYPYLQTKATAFCTQTESGVITAIRSWYDGYWAEPMYNATTYPVPQEWVTSYGTYRGYIQDGGSSYRWQDRGVKTTNFGEIREAKCPAQLMELLFHDDWKFYPDAVFHNDRIFRATVAWGMYTGICNYFGVTPKPRTDASVDSVSFPTYVQPGQSFSGTVTMRNLGMAWCWGDKWVSMVYAPYTVWKLKATTADQFGMAGTLIPLTNDGNYYTGDTATFSVNLTAPTKGGNYTTSWRMRKDDGKGGDFGATATAVIGVDAPYFTGTQSSANVLTGSASATTPVTLRGDVLITVMPSPSPPGFRETDPVTVVVDGVTTGPVTPSGGNYVCTATVDSSTANGAHQITVTVVRADDSVTVLNDWIYVNKNQISGTVTIPGFVGSSRGVTFAIDGAVVGTPTLAFSAGVAGYTLTNVPGSALKLSAKTAWTLREKRDASLSDPVNFTLRAGDINASNSVNVADYNILLSNWNQAVPSADVDGSGLVGQSDYDLMRTNWLKTGDPQ